MMLILHDADVVSLNLSVEEGIRLVVSGGILSPDSYPLPGPRDGGKRSLPAGS